MCGASAPLFTAAVRYSRAMTGRAVVRTLAAVMLISEGSLLILVVIGLMVYTSTDEDGAVDLSFPPAELLAIMALGAVLVAGAVGIVLRIRRSPRAAMASSLLVASALVANVVVVAFTLITGTRGMVTALAGIALALQATEWWLTSREPVVLR